MVEVIVTNEFPRLNAGSERRPFKVLTPPERSSKLVIARYSRSVRTATPAKAAPEPQDMVWKAIRVGSLCAAFAFAFFSFSQRNWFQRTGDTLGPIPESIQRLHFAGGGNAAAEPGGPPTQPPPPPDGKSVGSITSAPQTFALPDAPNLSVTEFNLSVNPQFQRVGNVALRLTAVNAAANTYDITVRTTRREFYRQDVKLAEHIALSRDQSADGAELVVGAISPNRVFGYVSEPHHRWHRRHRRR
jgi:hypothetical protein